MSVIKSKLNVRSEEFKANSAAMNALVADLREKTIAVSGGGSPETAAKHKARGKLLPRERINALIDPGAPFLEFSALVNGARVDFVDSPDYVYLDGHKKSVVVNGYETDRQLVVWKRGPRAGQRRVFPEP